MVTEYEVKYKILVEQDITVIVEAESEEEAVEAAKNFEHISYDVEETDGVMKEWGFKATEL